MTRKFLAKKKKRRRRRRRRRKNQAQFTSVSTLGMSQAPTVGPGLKNLSVLLVMTSPECLHDNQGRGAGSPLWVPFLLSSSSHHFDVSI